MISTLTLAREKRLYEHVNLMQTVDRQTMCITITIMMRHRQRVLLAVVANWVLVSATLKKVD